jgi:hypothetical protein
MRLAGGEMAKMVSPGCFAHLISAFTDFATVAPPVWLMKSSGKTHAKLANAIYLRTSDITKRRFKQQAAKIKDAIIEIISRQARHPAIQNIQDIFRQKADRLYHWADDRNVPADNNLAERELHPLVIARKISFGSQSEKGARTREILMTVLHTLKKRTLDAMTAFKSALDKLAEQPNANPAKLPFGLDSS